ncbi:hypothetical protein [Nocardia sp. NPDC046763]|uniref:hypothetical protein n=1 Tax=Nocardia sp. NPDC046763 TaxID=3155256 RepID=UPI0033C00916
MGITFATQNPGRRVAGLHHFNYEPLCRLAVAPVGGGKAPAGDYLVFGRVVIANFDDDFQDATARITAYDGTVLIDEATIRVSSGLRVAVSLQGTIHLDSETILDLNAGTYEGEAGQASLIAIQVDQLVIES